MTFTAMKGQKVETPEDFAKLKYPLMGSPKLDGIRAYIKDGKVWSYKNKLIPNKSIQARFGRPMFNGLDGELIVGEPTGLGVFNRTTSGVMSIEGTPDVKFYVFDNFLHDASFGIRHANLTRTWVDPKMGVVVVNHYLLKNEKGLLSFEAECLEAGYEGVVGRSLDGIYKQGRSTLREGYMWKLKRFGDSEAKIVGIYEKLHNGNEKGQDGKRTTHKAGKTGLGTLGGFRVIGMKEPFKGIPFDLGCGQMTHRQAQEIWDAGEKAVKGKIAKFKYQMFGVKDAPRIPVFLGFRDPRD